MCADATHLPFRSHVFDSIVSLETLEHSCTKEFSGAKVKSVENYAEALVVASHAIYKEQIYTLNDCFTVEEWTSEKALKLVHELKCGESSKPP